VAGAQVDQHMIIVTGVAGLLAGACSMGAGEYISVRSQREVFEYQIAIDQLNATTNMHEATVFLNGLKDIYSWKEENELVKNLMSLVAKRF
jgi:VIT1/CCC1 family predicted Fe2+/Mn2+ transporter